MLSEVDNHFLYQEFNFVQPPNYSTNQKREPMSSVMGNVYIYPVSLLLTRATGGVARSFGFPQDPHTKSSICKPTTKKRIALKFSLSQIMFECYVETRMAFGLLLVMPPV